VNQSDIEDFTGKSPDNEQKAKALAGDRLRSYIERIERLEEERKALAADVKDIYSEVKSAGFDVKVVRQLIRIRKQEPAEVEEQEMLLDIYRAAIGMLGGKPLSERTRQRFDPPAEQDEPKAPQPRGEGADQETASEEQETPPAAARGSTHEDIAAARAQGGEDQRAGKKITGNPWPFDDLRRAAWDEGWCAAAGTDGMDIPDAWRRRSKKPEGEK
jgi:uncharacterized protein (UPF0335 family)